MRSHPHLNRRQAKTHKRQCRPCALLFKVTQRPRALNPLQKEKHPNGYKLLGATGWTTSRLGFGCYRVVDHAPEHREALEHALSQGINIIDTSTNYGGGSSEQLVGDVLNAQVNAGNLSRNQVIVVSKIGYVQGANLELAQTRQAAGKPFADMVHYTDNCWHCIHPDFLEDQLQRSLNRLQLQTLDICLLHNPEYFFAAQKKDPGIDIQSARDEFYRRIQTAFIYFEEQVQAGRIASYGVSSNSSAGPIDAFDTTSLTRMIQCATKAATQAGAQEHHFRVLQLPMNLLEAGACIEKNNGENGDKTVLKYASEQNIGILVNRPLNGIRESLIRLADFTSTTDFAPSSVATCFSDVATLEHHLREQFDIPFATQSGSISVSKFFQWADELQGVAGEITGLPNWNQIENQMVRPKLQQVIQLLDSHLQGDHAQKWRSLRDDYLTRLNKLMAALKRTAATQSQKKSNQLSEAMEKHLPSEFHSKPLSQKALHAVTSSLGVSSVLCGMRQINYVDDALEVLSWADLGETTSLLKDTQALEL